MEYVEFINMIKSVTEKMIIQKIINDIERLFIDSAKMVNKELKELLIK